jgi:UDP-N-acetylglucosamine 3-dehydrogenase
MGRHHVRDLQRTRQCELIGIADPDESRKELAERYHTRFFADYRELLRQSPQLVSIAAPTNLHYELARATIRAGCHLLLEKPVCDNLEQARELVSLAETRKLVFAVGHIERFNPAVQALRQLIEIGELGQILTVHNLRVGPYHGRMPDTGIVLDLGIHDVDLISMLLGEQPQRVFATGFRRVHTHEDHAVIQLAFKDGRAGVIELSWNAPYRMRNILVSGSRRYAMCDLANQRLMVYEENEDLDRLLPEPRNVAKAEPLRAELESVANCVLTGTSPLCPAEDGIRALRLARESIESARWKRSAQVVASSTGPCAIIRALAGVQSAFIQRRNVQQQCADQDQAQASRPRATSDSQEHCPARQPAGR